LLVLTACVVPGSIARSATPSEAGIAVSIEPSNTWVGLARVHLVLSDMWLSGSELSGHYTIRVPLRPSRNDSGTIRLRSSGPLEHLRAIGGMLSGRADSDHADKTSDVACKVESDGTVRIEITTAKRTLRFTSRLE
jgi:hypothetical protein